MSPNTHIQTPTKNTSHGQVGEDQLPLPAACRLIEKHWFSPVFEPDTLTESAAEAQLRVRACDTPSRWEISNHWDWGGVVFFFFWKPHPAKLVSQEAPPSPSRRGGIFGMLFRAPYSPAVWRWSWSSCTVWRWPRRLRLCESWHQTPMAGKKKTTKTHKC